MATKTNVSDLSERLRQIKPHLSVILTGAIASIKATHNPLRFANSANALRELLREMLETLAPDECVKDCYWFVPNPSSKNTVTRKDRILYSIYGYTGNALFPKKFAVDAEKLAKRIIQQIDTLHKVAHVTPKSLSISPEEATRIFDAAIHSYRRLLKVIEAGREASRSQLAEILSAKLDEIFDEEIFENLNILSTHTSAQYTEEVYINEIDATDKDVILFSGRGSILCELQYGSDGDVRRGDGLHTEDSYPFLFTGQASTDLKTVELDLDSIQLDTSSFYE